MESPASHQRLVVLDVARSLGVVAMVLGHTLDAVLAPAARALAPVAAYWKARGLTAPLFLVVAGWAVALSVTRSPLRGTRLLARRLPRAAGLLALGYALRLPGWSWSGFLDGDRAVWQHFLAFDALHVVAVGIALSAVALALPLRRRGQGFSFVLLAAATVASGGIASRPPPATLAGLAFAQAFGGTSPFPIFPWLTYFAAGAAVCLLASGDSARRARTLLAVGAALVAAACAHGLDDLSPDHPVLLAFRLGAVLAVLGVLERFPARGAALLAPLGRCSLGVYALHVSIVYGWFTFDGLAARVGPRLPLSAAALLACAVLGATFLAARASRAVLARASHLVSPRGAPLRLSAAPPA